MSVRRFAVGHEIRARVSLGARDNNIRGEKIQCSVTDGVTRNSVKKRFDTRRLSFQLQTVTHSPAKVIGIPPAILAQILQELINDDK